MSERAEELKILTGQAQHIQTMVEKIRPMFPDFGYSFAATGSAAQNLVRQLTEFVEVVAELDALVEKHGKPHGNT
jgi:hypothetical protein